MRLKLLFILITTLSSIITIAQSPAKFKYQAVARDASGEAYVNKTLVVRVSILEGAFNGTSVYSEEHSYTTNAYGLINITIGEGSSKVGQLSDVNWSADEYFLKTELDINSSGSFVFLGSSQLLSVPFAMHAQTVTEVDDADADPENELQTLSFSNNTISLTDGGSVDISVYSDADGDSTNEIQTISYRNDSILLSNGGGVSLSTYHDSDADSTNELQVLSLSSDTLYLSDGGKVYVGDYLDNTDEQTLSINGNQISISGGNSITVTGAVDLDADPINELQALSISNDTIYLAEGGFVVLPEDFDGDSTNEIQQLTISGDTISLSNDSSIILPFDGDVDSANELQHLTISGDTVSLSNDSSIILPAEIDGDTTNELQTLSISNDTLNISHGNEIVLPSSFNLRFPDGQNNIIPIFQKVSDSSYTVPSGYNFYLLNAFSTAQIHLQINNNTIASGVFTSRYYLWDNPIIAGEGDILNIVENDESVYLNGFLVIKNVQPIIKNAFNYENDTIYPPPGYIMVITNIYNFYGDILFEDFNGNIEYINQGMYMNRFIGAQGNHRTLQFPIILKYGEKLIIKGTNSSFSYQGVTINGYIKEN